MPFSNIAKLGPPSSKHVEVCVFGPNYGECILIHLGVNNWIVVDSCTVGTTQPSALAYLESIDVDPAVAIKAVIATHWHDDHTRGLSKLIKAAPAAHLCIANALTNPEFLRFKARMRKNKSTVAGTKLNEFSQMLAEILQRLDSGSLNFTLANARTSIFGLEANETSLGLKCQLGALSPSHGDVVEFLGRIATEMPARRKTKRSISAVGPNEVSIVTLLEIGDTTILLGADLENSGKPTGGLEAIIQSHRGRAFGKPASLFKISHHGSETAYNEDIWEEMLAPNAFAVLTPWRNGGGRLPTKEGVERISSQTDRAYITASDARSKSTKSRPPSVKRQLRESNARVRSLVAEPGIVRFRSSAPALDNWVVELFGAACHVKQFVRRKPAS
jgi:beta-lactamase superfamily II metal-dependent hydrolase